MSIDCLRDLQPTINPELEVVILKAMAKRKRELIIPWKLKLLSILYLIWPTKAESIIMGAVGKEER